MTIACDRCINPTWCYRMGRCDKTNAPMRPEWEHSRDCLYVTSDGPAPCTCEAMRTPQEMETPNE